MRLTAGNPMGKKTLPPDAAFLLAMLLTFSRKAMQYNYLHRVWVDDLF